MRIFSTIFLVLLILIGITFAILNAEAVTFNYYVQSIQISLSVLLVFAVFFGVFLGFLAMLVPVLKLRKERSHLRHRVKTIEQEVENLRSLPVQDRH